MNKPTEQRLDLEKIEQAKIITPNPYTIMESRYNIGDNVRIIHYGHLLWSKKTEPKMEFPVVHETYDVLWYDISPELVGQEAVVRGISKEGRVLPVYALEGTKGKTAWYDEKQLELITDK